MSISDKVHKYLESGKRYEEVATPGPWQAHKGAPMGTMQVKIIAPEHYVIAGDFADQMGDEAQGWRNAKLCADARIRLPRYRRAIEEALSVLANGVSAHASCNDEDGCLGAVVDDVIDSIERALLGEDKPNSNSGELTPS